MSTTHPSSYLGEEFPITELMTRLQDQWSQLREESEVPITRVASFNLLVVSQGEDEETLEEILSDLKQSHPARVIWTKVISNRKWEECTARIHIGCSCDGEQICSEQVQLCCGEQAERVSSLVLPLIRAGLPTHLLWWKAGDTRGPLFERLCDRSKLVLLVDSNWKNLKERLPQLWHDPSLQEHNFLPLAWYQVLEARQLIASAYSENDIRIEFPKHSESRAECDLIASWVKTLVKGQPNSEGWTGEGIKLLENTERESMTLLWGEQQREIPLMPPTAAVSTALNKTRRDQVFGKVVQTLGTRT